VILLNGLLPISLERTLFSTAVLQSERGEAFEVSRERGLRRKMKCQSSKLKRSNFWEEGKTSSERESKIFSSSLGNEGLPQAIFAVKRTLKWSKKDF
jgi:hypothetical protein